ncbi:hypothetical protein V2J09_000262 [Rumex salicifolius]
MKLVRMIRGALFSENVSSFKKGQERLKHVKESVSQDLVEGNNDAINSLVAEPSKKRTKLPIRRLNEALDLLSEDDDFEEETLSVRRERLKQKKKELMDVDQVPKQERGRIITSEHLFSDNNVKGKNQKGKAKVVNEHVEILFDSDDDGLPSIKWRVTISLYALPLMFSS